MLSRVAAGRKDINKLLGYNSQPRKMKYDAITRYKLCTRRREIKAGD
jgi:hypothetical protein